MYPHRFITSYKQSMGYKRILVLFSIFLCLVSLHQVGGRPIHGETVSSVKHSNQSNVFFSSLEVPLIARYHLDALQDSNMIGHWAVYESVEGEYYGTKARVRVYGVPDVKPNQASSAEIFVANGLGGPAENFNSIQAGWTVNPTVYGDNDVHFFTYWTADGYKSKGCYNLMCKGFVMANPATKFVPGARISPLSTIDGKKYWIQLRIQKDSRTGDWWLFHEDENNSEQIGYWPKSLFTSLADKASVVEWGGVVATPKDVKSPPMGSGVFSDDDKDCAFFSQINYISSDGREISPGNEEQYYYVDRKDCYNVGSFSDTGENGGTEGYKFYFGGGGGCLN